MRELTAKEIEVLSNRTGVKKIAVENFLMTVSNNNNKYNALTNLSKDTKLYKWNKETVLAISDGIEMAFDE